MANYKRRNLERTGVICALCLGWLAEATAVEVGGRYHHGRCLERWQRMIRDGRMRSTDETVNALAEREIERRRPRRSETPAGRATGKSEGDGNQV